MSTLTVVICSVIITLMAVGSIALVIKLENDF